MYKSNNSRKESSQKFHQKQFGREVGSRKLFEISHLQKKFVDDQSLEVFGPADFHF